MAVHNLEMRPSIGVRLVEDDQTHHEDRYLDIVLSDYWVVNMKPQYLTKPQFSFKIGS